MLLRQATLLRFITPMMALLAAVLLCAAEAQAGPATTRDALDRLEELLEVRVDDGRLPLGEVTPAILVSAAPRYEESADWYATSAIEVLQGAFKGSLRLCEACMAPRTMAYDGALTFQTGPVGLDEVIRLDELTRGAAPPARSAIWLDEYQGGVSVRIIELRTGRVLFAQNVDPMLIEVQNSERMYTLSEELERRARGDSITQGFLDFALYPGQHISGDWTDQWGPTNANLSGLSISLLDPVLGIGACHYRVTKLYNVMFGGKLLLSLPTAIVNNFTDDEIGDTEVIDPLVNVVGVVRVPFGQSNYGAVLTASTNGRVGIGISLMNIRFLPVIP